jgi:hypothetical protein
MPAKSPPPPTTTTTATPDASPEEKFEAFDAVAEELHEAAEAAEHSPFRPEAAKEPAAAYAAGVWGQDGVASAANNRPAEPAASDRPAAPGLLEGLFTGSLQFGRANMTRTANAVQAMTKVRSPQEALAVQAQYVQQTAGATVQEYLRIGAVLQEMTLGGMLHRFNAASLGAR